MDFTYLPISLANDEISTRLAGADLFDELHSLIKPQSMVMTPFDPSVVVGFDIASKARLPFTSIVLEPIYHPRTRENLGTATEGNIAVFDQVALQSANLTPTEIVDALSSAREQVTKTRRFLLGEQISLPNIVNRSIIYIDTNPTSTCSLKAANTFFRNHGVEDVILTTPIITDVTIKEVHKFFEAIVYLRKVEDADVVTHFSESLSNDRFEWLDRLHTDTVRNN